MLPVSQYRASTFGRALQVALGPSGAVLQLPAELPSSASTAEARQGR